MSWLSDRTGIHIGSHGSTLPTAPPTEIASDPEKLKAYQALQKTLGQADSMNQGALHAAEAGGAAVLGKAVLGGGAGGTAAGALPVAGDPGYTDNGEPMGNTPSPSTPSGGGQDFLSLVKQYGGDVLAALNVYESAQKQGQSDKYAQDAIKGTTDAYNAKAPLRALGIAGMQNPGANVPDLSNIRQLSTAGSGNPFAKALPVAGAATGFKAPQAVLPTAPPSPTNPATVTPGAALPPGAAAFAGGLPGAPTPTAIPKRTIPVVGS